MNLSVSVEVQSVGEADLSADCYVLHLGCHGASHSGAVHNGIMVNLGLSDLLGVKDVVDKDDLRAFMFNWELRWLLFPIS